MLAPNRNIAGWAVVLRSEPKRAGFVVAVHIQDILDRVAQIMREGASSGNVGFPSGDRTQPLPLP